MTTNSTPTYHHSHTRARRQRPASLQNRRPDPEARRPDPEAPSSAYPGARPRSSRVRRSRPAGSLPSPARPNTRSSLRPFPACCSHTNKRDFPSGLRLRPGPRPVRWSSRTLRPNRAWWRGTRRRGGNKNLDGEKKKKKIRCFYVFCVMSSSMQCACSQLTPPGRASKVKAKAAKSQIRRFLPSLSDFF